MADSIAAVVESWKALTTLCETGSGGKMAKIGDKKNITRKEVCINATVLEPIVKHLGRWFFKLICL